MLVVTKSGQGLIRFGLFSQDEFSSAELGPMATVAVCTPWANEGFPSVLARASMSASSTSSSSSLIPETQITWNVDILWMDNRKAAVFRNFPWGQVSGPPIKSVFFSCSAGQTSLSQTYLSLFSNPLRSSFAIPEASFHTAMKSLGFPLPMTARKGLSQRHGNIPVCHVHCGSGQPPSQIETALVASAHAFVARTFSDVMILVLVADMQVWYVICSSFLSWSFEHSCMWLLSKLSQKAEEQVLGG